MSHAPPMQNACTMHWCNYDSEDPTGERDRADALELDEVEAYENARVRLELEFEQDWRAFRQSSSVCNCHICLQRQEEEWMRCDSTLAWVDRLVGSL